MKVLRFVFLALALLLQGGEAFASDPAQPPASCCCEDRCPCPMPPQAPRAPQAPTAPAALQAVQAQALELAAPAAAPRPKAHPWSGLPVSQGPQASADRSVAVRPEPDPPGGRERLLQTSLLRI